MLPFLGPRSKLNVEIVLWYITKTCFGVVYKIELGGGGGGDKNVFCQCSITL